jgi:hypothetical protein
MDSVEFVPSLRLFTMDSVEFVPSRQARHRTSSSSIAQITGVRAPRMQFSQSDGFQLQF